MFYFVSTIYRGMGIFGDSKSQTHTKICAGRFFARGQNMFDSIIYYFDLTSFMEI